ncbi:MAG: AI-2E family transporter [Chloroflexota bacterium]|nr:AI-2E family transporter [Chloroflexota bacterium]
MAIELTERRRRWVDALIILSTIAVGFVVLGFLADLFYFLGDVILVFFLAWLLAFILSPLVSRLTAAVPLLPRVGAVILVYTLLLGGLILVAVLVAGAMAKSIADFIASVPSLKTQLPQIVAPWQERLDALGLSQINLVVQAGDFLNNLNRYAEQLSGPLQQLAVASLGALGNLLIVLILSLYIVIDRDRILSFINRMVPPGFHEDVRLLETSVAKSFGGFLRGQALVGLTYGLVAVVTSGVLGLAYLPVTSAIAGLLMAIPFFGPFVSWVPPVLVAVLVKPDATIPAFAAMMVGWFVVMNLLQPRLMANAVGIHPIVVLGSVLIGSKVAGVTGAIFGIPIAAVLSAFFFNYLNRTRDSGPVSERAARRLEAREGRPVRVPREPAAGQDAEIETAEPARPRRPGDPTPRGGGPPKSRLSPPPTRPAK